MELKIDLPGIVQGIGNGLSKIPYFRDWCLDGYRLTELNKAQTAIDVEKIKNGECSLDRETQQLVPIKGIENPVEYSLARKEARYLKNRIALIEHVLKELVDKKLEDFGIFQDDFDDTTARNFEDDFFSYWEEQISHISSEQLQSLWARLLVTEMKSPSTVSRRTMQFITTIKPKDAQMLEMIFPYVVQNTCIPKIYNVLHDIDFGYLENLGILIGNRVVTANNMVLSSTHKVIHPQKTVKLSLYTLTDVGQELYKIIGTTHSPDFTLLEEAFDADCSLPVGAVFTYHLFVDDHNYKSDILRTYTKKENKQINNNHLPRISLK